MASISLILHSFVSLLFDKSLSLLIFEKDLIFIILGWFKLKSLWHNKTLFETISLFSKYEFLVNKGNVVKWLFFNKNSFIFFRLFIGGKLISLVCRVIILLAGIILNLFFIDLSLKLFCFLINLYIWSIFFVA